MSPKFQLFYRKQKQWKLDFDFTRQVLEKVLKIALKLKFTKNYFSKFNLFPKKILGKLDLQIVSILEEKTFNFQSKKKREFSKAHNSIGLFSSCFLAMTSSLGIAPTNRS